jgi:hypothetical protein
METDPVSETLSFYYLEFRTMDEVQKLNNLERYAPLSAASQSELKKGDK